MNLAIQQRWNGLAPHSRRWVVMQFVVGAIFVNAILSALIAWFFTLNQDTVSFAGIPVVDKTTMLVDTLGTLFILPFLTTLIVTAVVRGELTGGELQAPPGGPSGLPVSKFKRALLVGVFCFVVLAIPATLILFAFGQPDMEVGKFIAYKAIYGAILGIPITPVVALLAMDGAATAVTKSP